MTVPYEDIPKLASQVIYAIQRLPQREKALLARPKEDIPPSVFWRLLREHASGHYEDPYQDKAVDAWWAIMQSIAPIADLHDPKVPLGQALDRAGIGEVRAAHLLDARGDQIPDKLRAPLALLRLRQQPADLRGVFLLILCDGEDREDAVRKTLARGLYKRSIDESIARWEREEKARRK